ncbi:hypothetical protein [Flavobacterium rhizosphaerae]|uniref:Lipoprotein n=1 Tax=Flavobacterium rhizosphaerae TaxID=3163298 RepID=A0ABW8YU18_9FLAO
MKNAVILFLLALILFSCKQNSIQLTDNTHRITEKIAVGIYENNSYSIIHEDSLKQVWQNILQQHHKTKDVLSFLEIAEITSEGEIHEPCPVLIARTASGSTSMAALLIIQGNTCFIAPEALNIICHGTCAKGCLPVVINKNGENSLGCSACKECIKTETEALNN